MYNFALPKVDGVSTQPAAEMNSVFNELEGAVTSAGQSLTNIDNAQLSKAISTYSSVADFYTDGGSANNYVLSAIGSLKSPTAYYNGMKIRFYAGNTNSGASAVNVSSIGSVALKKKNGTTALVGGDIISGTYIEAVYIASQTCFNILPDNYKIVTKITMSGLQSIPGGNVPTKLVYDTVAFDNFSLWDSVNKRIISNKIGVWRINAIAHGVTSGASGGFLLIAYLNGSGQLRLDEIPAAGVNITLTGSGLLQTTSINDYFEIYVSNDNGGAYNFNGFTFEAEFITNY